MLHTVLTERAVISCKWFFAHIVGSLLFFFVNNFLPFILCGQKLTTVKTGTQIRSKAQQRSHEFLKKFYFLLYSGKLKKKYVDRMNYEHFLAVTVSDERLQMTYKICILSCYRDIYW
jgi:hypothetical protein